MSGKRSMVVNQLGGRELPKSLFILGFLLLLSTRVAAQTYPQDFGYSRYSEVLLDAGVGWQSNSMFHPLNISGMDSPDSSTGAFNWIDNQLNTFRNPYLEASRASESALVGIGIVGLEARRQQGEGAAYDGIALASLIYGELHFQSSWYVRSMFRVTNEARSLPHYSGVSRGIARFGFNSSEVDQGAIGYENEHLSVEYGRSREIWGADVEDNLILSGSAPSYESLKVEGRYNGFTYRYFYGFLEAFEDSAAGGVTERYIVGRGLEYRNGRSLVCGIGEVAILSGVDRSLEWGYLNPLKLSYESRRSSSNAVWIGSVDWLASSSLRLSGSFLVDRYRDSNNKPIFRSDLTGLQAHVAWTPYRSKVGVTALADYARMGTYCLMDDSPYRQFSTRSQVLGNSIGNDADKLEAGLRVVYPIPVISEFAFGTRRQGEMSLLTEPYKVVVETPRKSFPSGQINSVSYVRYRLEWQPFVYVNASVTGQFSIAESGSFAKSGFTMFELRLMTRPTAKVF